MAEGDGGTDSRGRSGGGGAPAERLAWWMRAAALLVRVAYRCSARIRVHGLDRVPSSGPLIIIANHTSNADPPIVGAWLQGRVGRPIRFMAKAQLWDSPLRPIVRRYRAILVRPGGSDVEAYRLGRQVLVDGGVLGLFPEGTRSPTGVLLDAHQGVTLLAARTGATVLPVGISGADRFLPPGSARPRIGARIEVRIGEPFTVRLDPARPRREAIEAASEDLMRALAALLPAWRRGRYDVRPRPPAVTPPAVERSAWSSAARDPMSALAAFSGEGLERPEA